MNLAAAAPEPQTAAAAQTLNTATTVVETQTAVAAAQRFLFQAVAGETPAGEHLAGVGAKNRRVGAFLLLVQEEEEKRREGEEKCAGKRIGSRSLALKYTYRESWRWELQNVRNSFGNLLDQFF